MIPTNEEVLGAFKAGFQSIDEGLSFWDGFDADLSEHGYTYRNDGPCICSDQGHHGHLPECRWAKD
ncbi:MAG: hypothetical protein V3S98_09390 [Dehalococcoidia bacterium]